MRKLLVVLVVTTALAMGLSTAAASLGEGEPTSLQPLRAVVAAIEAGSAGDGIVASGEGPIASHFQLVVNLGDAPNFYARDLDLTPIGLDTAGSPVDLTEFLGPNLEHTGQLPPLHPAVEPTDIAGQRRLDLAAVFDGWEAFGEFGPIDGPIPAIPGNTMIWGFELAQPFDTSCASAQAVGRAWESQSVVTANAPFETAALQEIWGSTHDVLADGTLGRLIQLNCYAGAAPAVETMRVNPDLGRIRPFGPLDIVALVKGDFVVFVGDLQETEDHARDVTFFATGATGSVETVVGDGPVPVLLPNPYDVVPQRIEFILDVDSIEAIAADGSVPPSSRTLLFEGERPGSKSAGRGGFQPVGLACALGLVSLFTSPEIVGLGVWSPQASVWRENVSWDGTVFSSEQPYADGSRDELIFDIDAGTFEMSIYHGPESDETDCRGTGEVRVAGQADAGTTAGSDDADGTDPSTVDDGDVAAPTQDDPSTPPASSDDGGLGFLAWTAIGTFILFVLGYLYWWFVVRPKRETYAYRADRHGGITYVDPEPPTPPESGAAPTPPVAAVERPPASSIVLTPPPDGSPCQSSYRLWEDAVERAVRLEAEIDARDPETDPAGDIRQDVLDDTHAAIEAYRRIYEACVADHAAPSTETRPPSRQAAGVEPPPEEPTPTLDPDAIEPTQQAQRISATVVVPKDGLTGLELERAERLESLYRDHKGTGDLAETALDFWYFNEWHIEHFGEPWFRWTTRHDLSVGITNRTVTDIGLVRDMSCYEFVHLVAWAASDQPAREIFDGPEGEVATPTGDYTLAWSFTEKVLDHEFGFPSDGDEARGEILTAELWGGTNNIAGYYHTVISVGDGRVVGLGADGLEFEDATGLVDGAFNAKYKHVRSDGYRYDRWNPRPGSLGR